MKEKQNWTSEKPKLENARRLRGIYFMDPEDTQFAEIIKNARKKLEVQTAPAMPCKRTNRLHGATCCQKRDHKSKISYKQEANDSKRLLMEGIVPKTHEDHIAGKGDNSLHHYNSVHKIIPMPQAMQKPAAKEAVDK